MSTTEINDIFLSIMFAKEPLLHKKFKVTEFIIAKGNEGEIRLFYTTKLFTDSEREKIVSLFKEALENSN